MEWFGTEAKVGAFVFAAFVMLAGFVLALSDFSWSPKLHVGVDFAHAGDLQVGAPVRLGGMKIGRVHALKLLPVADSEKAMSMDQPVLRATLDLEKPVFTAMKANVVFHVGTQGVVGETFIDMMPSLGAGKPLQDGAVVRGIDAPRWHVLQAQAAELLAAISGWSNSGSAGQGSFGQLAGTVHELLQGNRAEITKTIRLLAASVEDLHETLATVRRVVGDGQRLALLVGDTSELAHRLNVESGPLFTRAGSALAHLGALSERADRAISAKAVQDIAADLTKVTADLAEVANDVRALVKTIREGKGTIGGLVADPQLLIDLRDLVKDLKNHPWKIMWRD
jgi:phospholipid/cholesterol/gamma-HCH transport system substrate-binding protein